jgi:hypothetical protein
MPEPTLSELTHIPARDTGQPATVIDSSAMVAQLNQAAQHKAQNDLQKYKIFLDQLTQVSQDAQAIAALEVMPQDRDRLDKQRAGVFDIISKNPKAITGAGPDGLKLRSELARYMSDATRSKQDNAFDFAHRNLLSQNPEWSTEENKKTIDDFVKKPLGQRQQYNLNMPYMVDMGALLTGVFKDPTVTKTEYGWQESPDGKFLQEMTTTKLDHNAFMNRWNSGMSYQTDKYGRPITGYAKQLYDQMPDNKKKAYIGEDGQPDIKIFWSDVGETMFGSKEDITKTEKGKLEPNRFALQEDKYHDDIKKMFQKFDFDKVLVGMRNSAREGFELFKKAEGIGPAGAKANTGKALNDLTVNYIKGAQMGPGKKFMVPQPNGGRSSEKEAVNFPADVKRLFSDTKTLGTKVIKRDPDMMTVDADGNISAIFFKNKATKVIDPSLTRKVSPNAFKALIAEHNKLTGAFETSGEDLLENFGAPTLDGNVDKYYDMRFKSAPKEDDKDKPEENKKPKDKPKTKIESLRLKYNY